ncbi:diguanylate cyclase [Sphingobium sp. AS12]|uniref:diguanylate cyclase domain-containing protein n=1 Tax=Sphingobium sp. AS12 TaxID=2849495 RepID=UPI001C3167FD|nr:diguanylate cyclase [Sphingobium sp. AS12]MBV2148648.1 diguanylate cyclase [Sphingobium sp. AS12]
MTRPAAPLMPTLRHILARVHTRLILFAVLMAGVTLIAAGVLIMRDYAERNLALVARTASYTIEPALLFDDMAAAQDGIAMVANGQGVRLVEVRDNQGRLMTRWIRPDAGAMARLEATAEKLLWPSPVTEPVRHGRDIIARLTVHGDAGAIGRYLLSGVVIALACLGLTVIATQILARRLQKDVTGPLAQIADVAHAVRVDRRFDMRVPGADIAEVDQLARDFNALLDELQQWHAGLLSENRQLEHQATRDPLTGLGNRAMFERQLAASVEAAEQTGQGFAIIYADVNRFKQVNDGHGHDAGDVMLIVIAARLRAALRNGDLAFRLGGDEFALILASDTTREVVEALAARIDTGMEQPIMLPSGQSIQSSLSLGWALYPQDSADPRDLLRHADAAMYAAKGRRHATTD